MDKISGVYVVSGADSRIWVGESVDCHRRNAQATDLGWDWGIVQEMPGVNKAERLAAEKRIAKVWAARGFVVVSTHESWTKGKARILATREKISDSLKGQMKGKRRPDVSAWMRAHWADPAVRKKRIETRMPITAETRARMSASRTGKKASATTKKKMSVSHKKVVV